MLFHNSKDESAWGLALAGFVVVVSAIILGNITGNVQPKAPYKESHPDVSSPALHEHVEQGPEHPQISPVGPNRK